MHVLLPPVPRGNLTRKPAVLESALLGLQTCLPTNLTLTCRCWEPDLLGNNFLSLHWPLPDPWKAGWEISVHSLLYKQTNKPPSHLKEQLAPHKVTFTPCWRLWMPNAKDPENACVWELSRLRLKKLEGKGQLGLAPENSFHEGLPCKPPPPVSTGNPRPALFSGLRVLHFLQGGTSSCLTFIISFL